MHIDGIYVCPHRAGSGCNCRKPEIGMAMLAVIDLRGQFYHVSKSDEEEVKADEKEGEEKEGEEKNA